MGSCREAMLVLMQPSALLSREAGWPGRPVHYAHGGHKNQEGPHIAHHVHHACQAQPPSPLSTDCLGTRATREPGWKLLGGRTQSHSGDVERDPAWTRLCSGPP
jgi:hypothetical protein